MHGVHSYAPSVAGATRKTLTGPVQECSAWGSRRDLGVGPISGPFDPLGRGPFTGSPGMLTRRHWHLIWQIERELKATDLTSLDAVSLALDYIVARLAAAHAKVRARAVYWPPCAAPEQGQWAIPFGRSMAILIEPHV